MTIEHIQVKDLTAFYDRIANDQTIPITHLRAFSQINNPRSSPTDIALIVAYHENELIGYIGALPDHIHVNDQQHTIAWNSCWWSHPEKGKSAVMFLLLELFKSYNYNICFADLGERTKKIIAFTKNYYFQTYTGYRIFLRMYMHQLLPSKFKILNNKAAKGVLWSFDAVMNLFVDTWQYMNLKGAGNEIRYVLNAELSDKAENFIKRFPEANLSKRDASVFKWVVNYPWISDQQSIQKDYKGRYFFSFYAKKFKNYFLEISENNTLLAVIHVQEREGHFRIPYLFAEKENISKVWPVVQEFITKKRALSFISCHPFIIDILNDWKQVLKKQLLVRYTAIPVDFGDLSSIIIQDGDGDAVFC